MNDELLALFQAIGNFKTVGIIGVAVAAVYALTKLTKLPILEVVFSGRKWLRVLVAVVLGFAAGALSAIQSGAGGGWLPAGIASALTAGLAAVGLDQAITQASPTGRANVATAAGVKALIEAGDTVVADRVATAKEMLDTAAALPAGSMRRKALANWGERFLR